MESDVTDAVSEIRGTWDDDDPKVLVLDSNRNPVVADVNGTLRYIADGLVGPVDTDVDVIHQFVDDTDDVEATIGHLSEYADRFSRSIFEWDLEREATDGGEASGE